jgi:topoisomerase-4 subunit A
MEQVGFKDGDARHMELECKTTDTLAVLASSGKAFSVRAAELPSGRGDGAPMNTLIHSGPDEIVWIGMGSPDNPLLMANSGGYGFRCRLGDLASKTRQGKDFMSVPEGASALAPVSASGGSVVAALSADARLLLFPLEELPLRPNGGVGVQVMALPDKVSLAGVLVFDGRSLTVSGFKRTRKTAEISGKDLNNYSGRRAQRGRVCDVGFRPDRLGA